MKPLDYILLGSITLALVLAATGCASNRVLVGTDTCERISEDYQYCTVVR